MHRDINATNGSYFFIRIAVIYFVIMLLCAPAAANEYTAAPEADGDSILKLLEPPREYLTDNLLLFSDQVDKFISNTDMPVVNNQSYARISIASVFPEGAPAYPLVDGYLFFALARTQNKLNLLIQTDSATEMDTTGTDLLPSSPSQKTNGVAVQGQLANGENWSVAADIGTRVTNTLDPFFRISYQQTNQFDGWSLLWRESIYRFSYQGNGFDSQLRLDYPIDETFHISNDNLLSWLEQEDFLNRSHKLSLYQKLGDTSAISYSIGQYMTDIPFDNIYYSQVRYRRLFYKTWLYYEIIPEYLYPESTEFTASPRLTLKLEMLLGNP